MKLRPFRPVGSRSGWRGIFCFVALLSAVLAVFGGESKPSTQISRPKRICQAVRLTGVAPVIDGQLNDACWRELAEWQGEFRQLTPNYEALPTHSTEVKILYDNRHVYVAMRASDDPIALRSRQAGNRDSFVGDIMGVTFDSYHDLRTGFEFDLTASGQKLDLRLGNDDWDTTWNAVWTGKVAHDEHGWTAEFLIPLSQLRYDPKNTVWGLHAWRWIDRKKEESNWNPLANDDSGLVKSFGELHGLTGLPNPRRVEVLPYVSARIETEAAAERRSDFKGGLDAKIGLTSNVTLDASLWPDFGQVEADAAVMNLTAFETFQTEKRPLFLEGKDIFDFTFGDDRLFYSRRIGQPPSYRPAGLTGDYPTETTLLGALKVSGKTGQGFAFGALAAATDRETVTVTDANGGRSLEVMPRAVDVVVRGQQDLRRGDTVVGGILTHVRRDIGTDEMAARLPEEATTVGIDAKHYWGQRKYFAEAKAVGSIVRGDPRAISRLQLSSARYYQRPIDGRSDYDPTREDLTGSGWQLSAGKASGGRWRWSENLAVKTSGLEFNDLGYLAKADRVEQETEVTYVVKEPKGWYRTFEIELEQYSHWTTRDEHLGSGVEANASVDFRNKWEAAASLAVQGEGNDAVALRGGPLLRLPAHVGWSASLSSDSTKRFAGKVYAKGTEARDEVFGSSSVGAKITTRPWPALMVSLQADATEQVDRQRYIAPTRLRAAASSPEWFVSHLEGRSRSLALRAEWHLRPELSVEYYGNPFGSTVRQSEFRRVVSPQAREFERRFGAVLPATLTNGQYLIDTSGDGVADWTLSDPDSNGASFHSNLVVKWEYRRGSMLYFVWAQQREGADAGRGVDAWSALSGLRGRAPSNQFMVKLTYWFSA